MDTGSQESWYSRETFTQQSNDACAMSVLLVQGLRGVVVVVMVKEEEEEAFSHKPNLLRFVVHVGSIPQMDVMLLPPL